MRNRIFLAGAVAVTSLAFGGTARAQRSQSRAVAQHSQSADDSRPIELGVDAALSHELDGANHGTDLSIPISRVRAAFMVSDMVAIEPALSYQRSSASGSSFSTTTAGVGAVLRMTTDRMAMHPYLRPFVAFSNVSSSEALAGGGTQSVSYNQNTVGLGVGESIPMTNRISTRAELVWGHVSGASQLYTGNMLGMNIGLSFFTK